MKTKNIFYLSLICLPLFLTACSANSAGEAPPYFGNAVRQNIAVQTVNPDAGSNAPLDYDGARVAIAQHRYMLDKVEEPRATTTSAVQGGGK